MGLHRRMMAWGLMGAWMILALPAMAQTAPSTKDCAAEEPGDRPVTVEFVLSTKHKARSGEITRFLSHGAEPVTVRINLFPFLDPPANIGIGKCVSAVVGRAAIQAAMTYGTGVTRLIRQDILPHRWVKIGSTDTAELAWIAVSAEEMTRLTDPALTTGAFQALYRELAAPKERKRPFGMDSVPLDQKQ